MKYKLFSLTLLTFCIIILFSACFNNIKINGDVEEVVEVNSVYIDKGVTHPSDYTVITEGKIDTAILGTQQIKYSVFSSDGELKNEIYRFVKVIDSEAPTYQPIVNNEYYVGVEYTIDDFISEYKDNYDNKSNLKITSSDLIFTTSGKHEVTITISDSSNNTTHYNTSVDVLFDIKKMILDIYKNQKYKISTGANSDYIRVEINSYASFTYFDSGSLHYIEEVKTSLGNRSTIQISANYGKFDKANISLSIYESINSYSVGFAEIDATQSSVRINAFTSTINNLKLDTSAMLTELNENINTVLANFQKYMSETLHLPLVEN